MRTFRHTHLCTLLCFGIALLITGFFWTLDERIRTQAGYRTLGSIANQLISQIETLSLVGRQLGSKDGYQWAVEKISEGVEPRAIKVSRSTLRNGEVFEQTSIDLVTGKFYFSKLVAPESGTVIRVQIHQVPSFFLATQTKIAGDLGLLVIFLLAFSASLGLNFSKPKQNLLRTTLKSWLLGAKTTLVELGTQIRDTLSKAHDLAVSAGKARTAVVDLRKRIHHELHDLHKNGIKLAQANDMSGELLTSLNLLIQTASRQGPEAAEIAHRLLEIRNQVELLNLANMDCRGVVSQLQRRLEPIATDADLAFHAFDHVMQDTRDMDQRIRNTTATLLAQARLIQDANAQVEEHGLKSATR